jgi:hypothetical protein
LPIGGRQLAVAPFRCRHGQERPVSPAVQELLANIPEFDPRRRLPEEFHNKWTRTRPEPDKDHPYAKDTAP